MPEKSNGEAMKILRAKALLWLIPICALIFTGYLFKQHFYNHGSMITISFESASALQVEKTTLRYRGVKIGTVKNINLSYDQKSALVEVLLEKNAENFAVEGSKFWIVTPKVSLQGLSGLDTIFSGPYIEAEPGDSEQGKKTVFRGKQEIETHDAFENTVLYDLEVANAESITTGDSVTFRGVTVGEVGKMNLAKDARNVEVQIHIQPKFAKLIRTNSVFWRKVGVQANLGLFGSKVTVNSLDSIMHGGVECATPNNPGPIAKPHTKFVLAGDIPKDLAKWNPDLEEKSLLR